MNNIFLCMFFFLYTFGAVITIITHFFINSNNPIVFWDIPEVLIMYSTEDTNCTSYLLRLRIVSRLNAAFSWVRVTQSWRSTWITMSQYSLCKISLWSVRKLSPWSPYCCFTNVHKWRTSGDSHSMYLMPFTGRNGTSRSVFVCEAAVLGFLQLCISIH